MSSILDPLVVDSTQRPVCRIVRQGSADEVVYSHWLDDALTKPRDISAWTVSVVAVERLLCRIVDGAAGAEVHGPYAPFAPPDPQPEPATGTRFPAAGPNDFAVVDPADGRFPDHNAYAIRFPATVWPWPIGLPDPRSRSPRDPLVVVRTAIAKGGGVVERVPLLLAVRSGGLA